MFRTRNFASAVLATLAIAGLGACANDAQAPFEAEASVSQNAASEAGPRVAQLVALALREPSARGLFYRAQASSPVKENKLFLAGWLGGEGTPLLQAMARAGGMKVSEVQALVSQLGPVEIYLPVAEHRAAWTGGTDVQVAFAERDRAQPYGFDLNGRPVQLSIKDAPATPTVVVTYAESFDEKGVAHGANRPQAGPSGALSPRLAVLTVPYTGVWVDSIKTNSDFENWASGNPEFELYVQNAETRGNIACSGESAVEPYNFNMDGTSYRYPTLLAADYELPQSVPMVIAMFEDDDIRCKIVQDKDFVKLATDALTNANSAYKALSGKEWVNGEWIMQLKTAYVNVMSIIHGNDEFVGVSTTVSDINSLDSHHTLRNENSMATGIVRVQWKTDTGY